MNTFDNLFNRARDVANDLGQKANDVVEVSRLKLTVVSLGSDIDKVYQKLGLMVYEMSKAGSVNHNLIDGCVAEVDALKAKLDEINAKLDELKNVRRCDACGNAVDLSALFCPMCGNLLRKIEPTVDSESDPNPEPEADTAEEPIAEEAAAEEPEQTAAEEPEQTAAEEPEQTAAEEPDEEKKQ